MICVVIFSATPYAKLGTSEAPSQSKHHNMCGAMRGRRKTRPELSLLVLFFDLLRKLALLSLASYVLESLLECKSEPETKRVPQPSHAGGGLGDPREER